MTGRFKRATMSILGIYYLNSDVFKELVIPDGVDRETLIDNIIAECAELEILYQDPYYIEKLIGVWSRKEMPVWQKMYETTQFVYNPIWNVDAHIKETETRDLKGTFDSNETADGSNTGQRTGYNSDAFVNTDKSIVENEVRKNDLSSDTGTIIRESERGGNIGVTMTQQLIQAERDVSEFNIYDYIADRFKQRFCLLIY